MNQLELTALQQAISNEARTLYCLYLKPNCAASSQKVTIKNKQVSALLNSVEPVITRGRQITSLLQELADYGLVEIDDTIDKNASLNNKQVTLPLAKTVTNQSYSSMEISWRPEPEDFQTLANLVGLIDVDFNAEEIGEFIAYWLGRPETKLTAFQWTQKFVLQLKQRRYHRPCNQSATKSGHQWSTPKAGISFDQNVKNLIEQYSKKE